MEVQPTTNTSKIPYFKLWNNWEKLCPNTSFTVQNKTGSLYQIRLLTLQA